MTELSVNGTTLHCSEVGTGDPVIFVHGSMNDARTWDGSVPAFGEQFRSIVYSRRYHWPNEPIAEDSDYSMNEHVEDLKGLIQSLDAAPAHLVGHSYGAFVCLLLAVREPHLVRGLVLAEPPVLPLFASNTPKPTEVIRLLLTRPRAGLALIHFGATGIGPATAAFKRGDIDAGVRTFGRAVLGRETYESMSEDRMEQVRANTIPAEFLGSGFANVTAADVRGIQIDTLLVTGERSPALIRRLSERLAELLQNVACVEIAGASHDMHQYDPAAFNNYVLEFLKGSTHGE